ADRAHSLDRHRPVEQGTGHRRGRLLDAPAAPLGDPPAGDGPAPDEAVVVGVEEPDEVDASRLDALGDAERDGIVLTWDPVSVHAPGVARARPVTPVAR